MASFGMAGILDQHLAWHGSAWHGSMGQCLAGQGKDFDSPHGLARPGEAGRGVARLGKARIFKD